MDINDIRTHSSISFIDKDGADWIVYFHPFGDEDSAGRPVMSADVVGIEEDAEEDRWLDLHGSDEEWWESHEDAILARIHEHLSDRYNYYD